MKLLFLNNPCNTVLPIQISAFVFDQSCKSLLSKAKNAIFLGFAIECKSNKNDSLKFDHGFSFKCFFLLFIRSFSQEIGRVFFKDIVNCFLLSSSPRETNERRSLILTLSPCESSATAVVERNLLSEILETVMNCKVDNIYFEK